MNKKQKDNALIKAIERLQAAGNRRTQSREMLLRHLIDDHGPFSAEDLHQKVAAEGVDLVTVYRFLATLESLRMVQRCDFGDGIARYEFVSDISHHHHHVVCRVCRKAEALTDCAIQKLETMVSRLGYTDISHSLEFFGKCRSCQST